MQSLPLEFISKRCAKLFRVALRGGKWNRPLYLWRLICDDLVGCSRGGPPMFDVGIWLGRKTVVALRSHKQDIRDMFSQHTAQLPTAHTQSCTPAQKRAATLALSGPLG